MILITGKLTSARLPPGGPSSRVLLPPGGPSSRGKTKKQLVESGIISESKPVNINLSVIFHNFLTFSACAESPGLCANLLTLCSLILIMTTLPLSLFLTVRVVQVKFV